MRFSLSTLTLVLTLGGLDAVLARALPSDAIAPVKADTGSSLVTNKLEARAPVKPVNLKPGGKPGGKPEEDNGPNAPTNPKPFGSPASSVSEKAKDWDACLKKGTEVDQAIRARAGPGQTADRNNWPTLKGSKEYKVNVEKDEKLSEDISEKVLVSFGLNPQKSYRVTEVENHPSPRNPNPTYFLGAKFNKEEGAIVADWKFSKDYDTVPKDSGKRIPQSELMYQQWRDMPGPQPLKKIVQAGVVNSDTEAVILNAFKLTGKDATKPATFAPSTTNQKETDAFRALMGTENVHPTGYMVADHFQALGRRKIVSIQVFPKKAGSNNDYMAINLGT